MSEWKEYKLDEVCELIVDCVNRTAPTVDYATPYKMIRTTNVKNGKIDVHDVRYVTEETYKTWVRRGKPKIGDIVLTREAPVGEIGLVRTDDKLFLGQRTMMYRPNIKIADSDFLYYSFLTASLKEQILGAAMGSVVEHIRVPDAKDFKVQLPELSQQISISSILRSVDDKLDLLHRQNKTLEAMAETLFRQWFVEEAEESWEVGKLGDLVDFVYGKTLKDDTRSGQGYPVVGSSGIVGYHDSYLVEAPGLVTGRKGTLGKINYMYDNFTPIDTTFYILSKGSSEGLYFEYFLLKSLHLEEFNTDSAVPGLNRNIALSAEILLPPLKKIELFKGTVKPFFFKMKSNQTQIKSLTRLKDTLLPKLMTGEINIY